MDPEEKIASEELAPCLQRLARLLARDQGVLAFHSEAPKTIASSRNPSYCLRKFHLPLPVRGRCGVRMRGFGAAGDSR